ncbi:MAG: ankyrin repeat domain-containing protein [Bacteroidetes Order II. Incertae sedis bacterium]|nr:ankyrin repeat domain-containing protein [Bacteroidetes Order II. bacterium]
MRHRLLFLCFTFSLAACIEHPTPEQARAKLQERKIPFTETAFIEAFSAYRLQEVQWFLEAGMKPDVADGAAWRIGIQKNYFQPTNLLMLHGAKPDQVFSDGFVPLVEASAYGRTRIVTRMMAYHPKVDVQDPWGRSALMMGAKSGNAYVMEQLLQANPALEATDQTRRTALQYAIQRNHSAVTQLLLDAGANANVGDRQTTPPLISASYLGNVSLVNVLLKKGANPNATNATGYTALMAAVRANHMAIVDALLAAGADPNRKNVEGWQGGTALHLAALQHNKAMMEKLRNGGANPNITDHFGQTADTLLVRNEAALDPTKPSTLKSFK